MSISREEFLRVLSLMPSANKSVRVQGDCILLNALGQPVQIRLETQPDVIIGALTLPSFRVTICLDIAVFDEFMANFDRTFQRGGG